MTRHRILATLVLASSVIATGARAQVADAAADKARRDAVGRGLAYLGEVWKADAGDPLDNSNGGGVAVASLSGIVFLQSGSAPDAGPYRAQVNRCLDYVLTSSRDNGLLAADQPPQGPMYGHGFGMLFLSEAYVRSKDDAARKRILPVLEKAVTLAEKAQNKEGGWRYQPVPYDADVSVTVGQLNGLLAAKAAGVRVSPEVLTKASDYVKSCQNDDGGFSYMAHRGNSGLPRSAAALAALQHAGAATPAQRDKAVAYIAKVTNPDESRPPNEGHVFYAQYYLSQALTAAGGNDESKTSAAFRDRLIKQQRENGSWTGDFNDTYSTAMALIALQMPDGWLTVLAPKKNP
jgi:hypothetical protein